MSSWQVSEQLSTTPAVVETTSLAKIQLAFDTTALLGGRVPTEPRTRLIDLTTGLPVRVAAPTLVANVITQALERLARGHDYELTWAFTLTATEQPSRITIVRVVA